MRAVRILSITTAALAVGGVSAMKKKSLSPEVIEQVLSRSLSEEAQRELMHFVSCVLLVRSLSFSERGG